MKADNYKNAMDKITADEKLIQKITSGAEQKNTVKPKKRIFRRVPVIIAAAVAALALGIGVCATEPELIPELVGGRWVVYAKVQPQEPVKGFTWVKWLGEKIPPEDISLDDREWFPKDGMYLIKAQPLENGGYIEKFATDNGDVTVICPENEKGFAMKAGQTAVIEAIPDDTAPYSGFDKGERAEIGYILDGAAHMLFGEKITADGEALSFTAERDGEYRFYIVNWSAGTQNYKKMQVTIN